jgi:hypothetical protein
MTVDELKGLVNEIVDQKLHQQKQRSKDPRSLQKLFDEIDQHIWTPPPGAKSTLELLREDRDR